MLHDAIHKVSDFYSHHGIAKVHPLSPSGWPEFGSFPQLNAADLVAFMRLALSYVPLHLILSICMTLMCLAYCTYIVWYRRAVRQQRDNHNIQLALAAVIGSIEVMKVLSLYAPFWHNTSSGLNTATMFYLALNIACLFLLTHNTNYHTASYCVQLYFAASVAMDRLIAVYAPIETAFTMTSSLFTISIASRAAIVILEWTTALPETVSPHEDPLFDNNRLIQWPSIGLFSVFDFVRQPIDLSCEQAAAVFQANWDILSAGDSDRIVKAFACTFSNSLISIAIPRLACMILTFAQPIFLVSLLKAIVPGSTSSIEVERMLATAAFLFIGKTASKTASEYLVRYNAIAFRSVLTTAVFSKSLKIGKSSSRQAGINVLLKWIRTASDAFITKNFAVLGAICEAVIGTMLLIHFVGAWTGVFIMVIAALNYAARIPSNKISSIQSNAAVYSVPSKQLEWRMLADITSTKMTGMSNQIGQHARKARREKMKESRGLWLLEVHSKHWGLFTKFIILTVASVTTLFYNHADLVSRMTAIFPVFIIASIVSEAAGTLSYRNLNDVRRMFQSVHDAQKLLQWDELQDRRSIGSQRSQQLQLFSDTDSEPKGKEKVVDWRQTCAIVIEEAMIGPIGSNSYPLNAVDLLIEPNDVVIILGPQASRKTLLLDAIAGITSNVTTASIYLQDASVAYCSKRQWVENSTVRENVIGPNEIDTIRYADVLIACMLDVGLLACKQSDTSVAGVDGANLAPSVRERVAIARALYSKSNVLLLDTPFVHTWPQITRQIINNIFEPETGFLTRYPKTVVVATECPIFMAYANVMCLINREGALHQCYSRQEILTEAEKISSYSAPVLVAPTRPDLAAKTELASFKSRSYRSLLEGPMPDEEISIQQARQKSGVKMPVILEETASDQPTVDQADHADEPDEPDQADQPRQLDDQVKSRRELFTRVAKLTMFAALAQTLAEVYLTKELLHPPALSLSDRTIEYLFVLHHVLQIYTSAVYSCYMTLVPKYIIELHARFVDTYTRVSVLSSTRYLIAILDAVFDDLNVLERSLRSSAFDAAYSISYIAASLLILSSTHQVFAYGGTLSCVAVFGTVWWYIKGSQSSRNQSDVQEDWIENIGSEYGEYSQLIRSLAWQGHYFSRFCKSLQSPLRILQARHNRRLKLKLIVDGVIAALAVATVFCGLIDNTSLSPCYYAMWYMILLTLSDKMDNVLLSCDNLAVVMRSAERIYRYLDEVPLEKKPRHAITLPQCWPHNGHIVMSSASSYYDKPNGNRAIRNMTCDIFGGASVLLTGGAESGGPAMFVKTLLNMVERDGLVLIDGVDPMELKGDELRSRITTLVANPPKLWGTFRECLITQPDLARDTGVDLSDPILEETLEDIGMLAAVRELGGLDGDAKVTNRGWDVAQRQIFAIGQAMIHHAIVGSKLIILDHATYDLFDGMDMTVQHFIRQYFKGTTLVYITSRRDSLPWIDYHIDFDEATMNVTHCSEKAHEYRAIVKDRAARGWTENTAQGGLFATDEAADERSTRRASRRRRAARMRLHPDDTTSESDSSSPSTVLESPLASSFSPGLPSNLSSPGYDSSSTLRQTSPFDGSPAIETSSDEEPFDEDACPEVDESCDADHDMSIHEQNSTEDALYVNGSSTDDEPLTDDEYPFTEDMQAAIQQAETDEALAQQQGNESEGHSSSTVEAEPATEPSDEAITLCNFRKAYDPKEPATPPAAGSPSTSDSIDKATSQEPFQEDESGEDDDGAEQQPPAAGSSRDAATLEDCLSEDYSIDNSGITEIEITGSKDIFAQLNTNDLEDYQLSLATEVPVIESSDDPLTLCDYRQAYNPSGSSTPKVQAPSSDSGTVIEASNDEPANVEESDELETLCNYREAYTPPTKHKASFESPKKQVEVQNDLEKEDSVDESETALPDNVEPVTETAIAGSA